MHRDQPGPRPSARPCARRALVPAVLGLAALLPTTAAVAAAPPQGEIRSTVAAPVDYRLAPAASGAASSARAAVAPAATSVPGVPGPAQSRWQVSYTGFSPEARAAFERAVAIWAGTVRSPVPITVSATMRDLGDRRLLGRTSPSVHVGGELGDGGTAYPGALADALIGEDIAPDLVDIATTLNLVPENAYYFGTDGRPGPGQVDFTTVVLHELGHGLGLSSSLRVDAATGLGTYGDPGDPTPYVFDRLVADASGRPLLPAASGTTDLGTRLKAPLTWSGRRAARSNAGALPALHSPSTWQAGGSATHLSETAYPRGSAESLMTPALGVQEAVHDPGGITRGMLVDLGWPLVGDTVERSVWSSAAGVADVAERRADGSVALRTWSDAGLSTPQLLGGAVRNAPGVARRPSGGIDLFARGTDDRLYTRYRDPAGSWTPWQSLGGVVTSAPAVTRFRNDELHVFARGGDGQTWHIWSTARGVWSRWEPLGGRLKDGTGPGAVSPASGQLEVVVQGTDGQAWRRSYVRGWTGFTTLGGSLLGSPSLAAPGGRLLVNVLGTNGVPYARTATTGWSSLGGALAAAPVAASAPGGDTVHVFGRSPGGLLYVTSQVAGRWSGWRGVL